MALEIGSSTTERLDWRQGIMVFEAASRMHMCAMHLPVMVNVSDIPNGHQLCHAQGTQKRVKFDFTYVRQQ
jgi:hypothetical protein